MADKWTKEEDELLAKTYNEGFALVECAYRINTATGSKRHVTGVGQRLVRLRRAGMVKNRGKGSFMATKEALSFQSKIEGFEYKPSHQIKLVGSNTPKKASVKSAGKNNPSARKASYPAQLARLAKDAEGLFNVAEFIKAAAADDRTIHDVVEDLNFVAS